MTVAGVTTTAKPGREPRRPTLQAVLIDMDGTLVDTEPTWFATEVQVMGDLGYTLDARHEEPLLGKPMDRAVAYLLGVSGVDIAPAELEQRINDGMVARLRSSGVDLRPGAKQLLTRLEADGIPCALVTASHRAIVDAVLPSLGADHFAFSVAGDEVTQTKPSPEPYLTAAAALGAEPVACVVIEDSPTGIAAGEAAGCAVLAVPSTSPIPEGPGRTVIASLESVDVGFLKDLLN